MIIELNDYCAVLPLLCSLIFSFFHSYFVSKFRDGVGSAGVALFLHYLCRLPVLVPCPVCVCVCVRARVCVCACVCVRVCVFVCVY